MTGNDFTVIPTARTGIWSTVCSFFLAHSLTAIFSFTLPLQIKAYLVTYNLHFKYIFEDLSLKAAQHMKISTQHTPGSSCKRQGSGLYLTNESATGEVTIFSQHSWSKWIKRKTCRREGTCLLPRCCNTLSIFTMQLELIFMRHIFNQVVNFRIQTIWCVLIQRHVFTCASEYEAHFLHGGRQAALVHSYHFNHVSRCSARRCIM